jgi:peptidoglycan LD-endopeptidase LytH
MKWARHPRTRFLLAFVGIVAVVGSLVVRLSRVSKNDPGAQQIVSTRAPASPEASISREPAQGQSPAAILSQPTVAVTPAPISTPIPGPSPGLIIPVAGVRAEQLHDTFADARSEGRAHDAIDIAAPQGTPVLAVADGSIIKLFQSDRGGTTIYQLSSDGKYFYYYAHLDRYAESLAEGQSIKQGATIAYVGDSGNAGPGNYHLHFSIALVSDPKRYWEGVNINPYPLLRK